jgi:hypothetical protein
LELFPEEEVTRIQQLPPPDAAIRYAPVRSVVALCSESLHETKTMASAIGVLWLPPATHTRPYTSAAQAVLAHERSADTSQTSRTVIDEISSLTILVVHGSLSSGTRVSSLLQNVPNREIEQP